MADRLDEIKFQEKYFCDVINIVTLRQIRLLSQNSFRGEMGSRSTRCLTTAWSRREHPPSLELVVMDSHTVVGQFESRLQVNS